MHLIQRCCSATRQFLCAISIDLMPHMQKNNPRRKMVRAQYSPN
jgi:hypothetical protein